MRIFSNRILYAASALTVVAAACGPLARSSQVPKSTSPPRVAASASVSAAVAALQDNYSRADWTKIGAAFTDLQAAAPLLTRMKHWKSEQVKRLQISLVYLARLQANRYVGTVQFAADARAVPEYSIFVFSTAGRQARIVGTTTGIQIGGSDPHWAVSRTPHFLVYHSRYQLAGTDRRYLADLEHQRAEFARKFGVKLPPLAAFYLFPDRQTMSRMTGGSCGSILGETGCTRPFTDPPTIETLIRATYHEPIHVYELALQPPLPQGRGVAYVAPLFIGEGTAVALEDKNADPRLSDYCSDLDYAPLDECARIAIAQVKPLSILRDVGFRRADPGYAYSLGGSFVKYLILRYGYRQFGRYYYTLAAQPSDQLSDYNVASQRVYHRSMDELITRWTDSLCRKGC